MAVSLKFPPDFRSKISLAALDKAKRAGTAIPAGNICGEYTGGGRAGRYSEGGVSRTNSMMSETEQSRMVQNTSMVWVLTLSLRLSRVI